MSRYSRRPSHFKGHKLGTSRKYTPRDLRTLEKKKFTLQNIYAVENDYGTGTMLTKQRLRNRSEEVEVYSVTSDLATKKNTGYFKNYSTAKKKYEEAVREARRKKR